MAGGQKGAGGGRQWQEVSGVAGRQCSAGGGAAVTGSGSGGENVAGSGKGVGGSQTVAGRVLFPCEIILFSSEHDYTCLGTSKKPLLRGKTKQ